MTGILLKTCPILGRRHLTQGHSIGLDLTGHYIPRIGHTRGQNHSTDLRMHHPTYQSDQPTVDISALVMTQTRIIYRTKSVLLVPEDEGTSFISCLQKPVRYIQTNWKSVLFSYRYLSCVYKDVSDQLKLSKWSNTIGGPFCQIPLCRVKFATSQQVKLLEIRLAEIRLGWNWPSGTDSIHRTSYQAVQSLEQAFLGRKILNG